MYGLELVKAEPDQIKRGTIYVTLGRMADKGYVESREVPANLDDALPYRLFHITTYGTHVLNDFQPEPKRESFWLDPWLWVRAIIRFLVAGP